MLARGELRAVGATTLDEYRKHIEKDAALERRFQPVFVGEPSVADTIAILRGLKDRYEAHHSVRDPGLRARRGRRALGPLRQPIASFPTRRSISSTRRRLVCAWRSTRRRSSSTRRSAACASSRSSWRAANEPDDVRAPARERARRGEGAPRRAGARWSRRRKACSARGDQGGSTSCGWRRSARSASGTRRSPRSATALSRAREGARGAEQRSEAPMVKEEVDEEDIAEVVATWTGSRSRGSSRPRSRSSSRWRSACTSASSARRGGEAVSKAVRRARSGLQDPNRPIGSFVFLGPTGVGKTELARALAEFLFDDERAMVRLDMSEYLERHTVARLVGRRPATSATRKAGSSPRPCAAGRTPCCSSTRSRRRTPTSSTRSSSSSTTAG